MVSPLFLADISNSKNVDQVKTVFFLRIKKKCGFIFLSCFLICNRNQGEIPSVWKMSGSYFIICRRKRGSVFCDLPFFIDLLTGDGTKIKRICLIFPF